MILLVILLTTSITSIVLLRRQTYTVMDCEKSGYEADVKGVPELRITFPEDDDNQVKSVIVRISQAGCAFVTPVVEDIETNKTDEKRLPVDVQHVVSTVPMPY